MSKHKKRLYGVILAVAGLALVLDRLNTDVTPSRAQGYSSRPLSALGVDSAETPSISVAAAPFPAMEDAPSGPIPLRDVFAITETVRSAMFGEEGGESEGPGRARGRGGRVATSRESFADIHHLKGVMSGTRASFAIVDDRWLQVGDHLDGCALIAMTGTTATFHCPAGDVTLSVMPAPSGGKPER